MEKTILQPYRPEDDERVIEFFANAHAAVRSMPPVSPEIWREFTSRSYNHGGRDFVVAVRDQEVVALLTSAPIDVVRPRRQFRIFVLPRVQRRGLGGRLFDVVRRQGGAPGYVLSANCPRSWKAGCRFLEARRFSVVDRTLEMRRACLPPSPVNVHAECSFRPYRPGPRDDGAWIRLHDDGYRETPDFTPLTLVDIAAVRSLPGFSLWFLELDQEIVGFCEARPCGSSRASLINSIVIDRDHRGRHLGGVLLERAMGALHDAGAHTFELSVDSTNDVAVRMYRGLGFETHDEVRVYERAP